MEQLCVQLDLKPYKSAVLENEVLLLQVLLLLACTAAMLPAVMTHTAFISQDVCMSLQRDMATGQYVNITWYMVRLQAVDFDMVIYNPFRPLDGLIADLRTWVADAGDVDTDKIPVWCKQMFNNSQFS